MDKNIKALMTRLKIALIIILFFFILDFSLGFINRKIAFIDVKGDGLHIVSVLPYYFQRDRLRFWKLRPTKVVSNKINIVINSKGFRGDEFSAKKPHDTIRIFCMGASSTFGYKIPLKELYNKKLEKLLTRRFPLKKFEVINAGISGYTTLQGLRFLQGEIINYDPDVITIYFGWNEHSLSLVSDKEQAIFSKEIFILQEFLERSELYKFFRNCIFYFRVGINKILKGQGRRELRVSLSDFKDNLREIVKLTRDRNIKLYLLTAPINKHIASHQEISMHSEYNMAIRDIAAEQNVPLVDIAEIFDKKEHSDDLFLDVRHPSSKGYQYIAEAVSKYITF